MKRVAIALLAGVAAVAGLSYTASAADLAIPPPPPPLPSWTGFYVGAHAGAAMQTGNPDWRFNDPNGFLTLERYPQSTGQQCARGCRWLPGRLQLAVRRQRGWSASKVISRGRRSPITGTTGPLILRPAHKPSVHRSGYRHVQMSANTQWLASARGRLGFVGWWNTMFYATGGVAWANIEYAAQFTAEPPNFQTDIRSVQP